MRIDGQALLHSSSRKEKLAFFFLFVVVEHLRNNRNVTSPISLRLRYYVTRATYRRFRFSCSNNPCSKIPTFCGRKIVTIIVGHTATQGIYSGRCVVPDETRRDAGRTARRVTWRRGGRRCKPDGTGGEKGVKRIRSVRIKVCVIQWRVSRSKIYDYHAPNIKRVSRAFVQRKKKEKKEGLRE